MISWLTWELQQSIETVVLLELQVPDEVLVANDCSARGTGSDDNESVIRNRLRGVSPADRSRMNRLLPGARDY